MIHEIHLLLLGPRLNRITIDKYVGLIESNFIAIFPACAAVDGNEFLTVFKCYQRHVPHARLVVDALLAVGHQRHQLIGPDRLGRGCDYDYYSRTGERDEGLAAQTMALNERYSMRPAYSAGCISRY